jgi:hypothetical protein
LVVVDFRGAALLSVWLGFEPGIEERELFLGSVSHFVPLMVTPGVHCGQHNYLLLAPPEGREARSIIAPAVAGFTI